MPFEWFNLAIVSELVASLRFKGLQIEEINPNSPASRAGLAPRDVIRKVGDYEVNDLIDFRYHTSEERFALEIVRDGRYQVVTVERKWGEDLGIRFTFELADQIHTCDNKCVFCFIHQMPKGMRKTLYLMDDDFRLSFLHGNYVTLTNMGAAEFERVMEQAISPLYVSVHTTDPRLRAYMLGRTRPEPILPRLTELHEAGIDTHCQVVVCPGLNDEESLDLTVRELAELHVARTGFSAGALSVAVVPVGLTQFRQNLYPIRQVSEPFARRFLSQAETWHETFLQQLGTRFVFPTDEWFFYARQPIPERPFYEEFPQFEDGVGTCRMFMEEAREGFEQLGVVKSLSNPLTLVTGELAADVIREFAHELAARSGIEVRVLPVKNQFFGEGITVAGLVTGQDLIGALRENPADGVIAVPTIMLKDETLFLDDLSIRDVRDQSGLDVRVCPHDARKFLVEWMPKACA